MDRPTIAQKDYIQASQLFHWATKDHYKLWFTGRLGVRHRRTEVILPRLVNEKKLVAVRYGKNLVYTSPRRVRREDEYRKIEHGLSVTEGLVRFWLSDKKGTIVQERYFYGLGVVPEFGIIYPNGNMLLYEFCTQDNFERTSRMLSKIYRYQEYQTDIDSKFNVNSAVIFVVDVSSIRLRSFLQRYGFPQIKGYFVDYQSFKSVPIGNQFEAPIYIFGDDLKTYKLR